MRFYVLRALLGKEVRRHFANRGGLALAALLVVAALLLSVFNPKAQGLAPPGTAPADAGAAGGLVGGVHTCIIQFPDESLPLARHLRANKPNDLRISFAPFPTDGSLITLPPGTGSIQIRPHKVDGRDVLLFQIWYPTDAADKMWAYEQWFLKEARRGLQKEAAAKLKAAGVDEKKLPDPKLRDDDLWAVNESFRSLNAQVELLAPNGGSLLPVVEIERKEQVGAPPLDFRSAIATAMVVFSLYFTCVYLLPTLTCEERERGVLLAQALSPASPVEILTAKFLFYPTLGIGLAATLAGIYRPAVLTTPFFWLALVSVSGGFLGIGMTIATLAKTQRAAFMGSMCYLMSVALILFICQQNGIPGLPMLAVEYHGPRVLHAAVTGSVAFEHWLHLAGSFGLAVGWVLAAGYLFRKRGWQ